MKSRSLFAGALLGLSAMTLSLAANATPSASDFAKKVTVAVEFEIESSKLALEKSQNKDIKSFAQQMITDHGKANDDLKSALESANLEVPKEQLDSKHQKLMKDLQDASGDDFNKLYVKDQVAAHKKAVSLFSEYAKNGDNNDLKDFASQTLPTLQDHLTHAKELKSKL